MFRSINSKILCAQFLIVIIGVLSLGMAVYFTTAPYIRHMHQEKNEFIANTWAQNIARFLADRTETISTIANSEVIEAYSFNFREGLLTHYLTNFQEKFPVLIYLNEKGEEDVKIIHGDKVEGRRHHSEATARARKTPNTPVFELITRPTAEHSPALSDIQPPYLEFAIYSLKFGEFNGLIVGQIPINQSAPELKAFTSFRFSKNGFLSLYDTKGHPLLSDLSGAARATVVLPEEINDIVSSRHYNCFSQRNTINTIDSFSTYSPVPETEMIVSATIPYSQFQKAPREIKKLFIMLAGFITIVCILISVVISRSIARPILHLANVSSRLAKGEWDKEIKVSGHDETAVLSRSFKEMVQHIHQMIRSRDNEIELRKKVEHAIKISHLELDQIFNNAAGGKLVIDRHHKILRVNDTFLTMMGYQREEVVGENCFDLAHDAFCGTDHCVMEQVLVTQGEVKQEVTKTRKDGSPIICTLVAVPFYGDSGDIVGIIEDFRDITRTKKAEELLRISESRYRLLFDSAPDGIAVLNDQGVIIDCNPSQATIHQRPRADLIGHHFSRFNTPESKDSCYSYFDKLKESTQEEGEVHILVPDGRTVTIWRKGTIIQDKNGYFRGVLLYDRDITKQKKVEELQEDMARIARHDLKTPLNGIINLPTLIKMDKNLTETQEKRLDLIEDAGYQMLRMINASLDLYKMEQDTYDFKPTTVDICAIVCKIKADLWSEMQTNQNDIIITINQQPIDDNSSFLVWGDELLCYSMLANILKNAVESSPKAMAINISLEKSDTFIIKVHNHGQVPPEVQRDFFKKYSTSGKKGGTGLGTYSARLMARTQGGEITVESSEKRGTTVTITMPPQTKPSQDNTPAEPSHKMEPNSSAQPTGQSYNILLAEDDPINQALATALLHEKKGINVTAVDNGKEAIEAIAAKKFDLILMDMQMPEIDGLEATVKIRRQEKALNKPAIPVVAITGMAGEGQKDKFFSAGVSAFLAKPLQVGQLWQTISTFLDIK